ncbi:MAG: methyltransferase [Holosporaceae bacterium]|jgi:tRNA1(Val) A37 N6-methylase TrmN6|nr:methyltransferase [Holosporaceae bacterium]
MEFLPDNLTNDSILSGRIKLLQPKVGYRVAVDPIILAHFINIKPEEKILDVGCGVGTVSLILKSKEKLAQITAIDVDEEMCRICVQNSLLNSLEIEVKNVAIEKIDDDPSLRNRLFDRVVTNPPFLKQKSSRISESKKLANFETIDLCDWIAFCVSKLKNNGILSIIHRASRLDDILQALKDIAGSVVIIPIFPKKGRDANRVVVQAKKSGKSEAKICFGIVAHNDDGSYSEDMRDILY